MKIWGSARQQNIAIDIHASQAERLKPSLLVTFFGRSKIEGLFRGATSRTHSGD